MEKELMIDYRDENMDVCRKTIDDMEFCVRNSYAYFASAGKKYKVPLDSVIQVYTTVDNVYLTST